MSLRSTARHRISQGRTPAHVGKGSDGISATGFPARALVLLTRPETPATGTDARRQGSRAHGTWSMVVSETGCLVE